MDESNSDVNVDQAAFKVLSRFESLGANCEFGFVQERAGVNVASLFRWAEIPSIEAVKKVIDKDFHDVYRFENIEPYNPGMVRDRSNWIAWHSNMRSQITDPSAPPTVENHSFLLDTSARRTIYEEEIGKVDHLIARTRASISSGNRIFVYKSLPHVPVREEDLTGLLSVLAKDRVCHLLYVSVAPKQELVGSVTMSAPGLLLGYVDRFAPGENASDVSFDVWLQICQNALRLCDEKS